MLTGKLIHQSAIVHKSARIGVGAIIGPRVRIAEDVVIGAYSVIGGSPEHRDFYSDVDNEKSVGVTIEAGARIYEFVTIHSGTVQPTHIGENVAIFNHTHIAHDCTLERGCTIGGGVSLAGHVWVMTMANVSGRSCIHQRCVVGAYSILSAASYLKAHMPPGEKWIGSPARPSGFNDVGLQRAGLTQAGCSARYLGSFDQLKHERII